MSNDHEEPQIIENLQEARCKVATSMTGLEEELKNELEEHEEEITLLQQNKDLQTENVRLLADLEGAKEEIMKLKESLARASFTPGTDKKLSTEELFAMLPNDDTDTFKAVRGSPILFRMLHGRLRFRKILQWWVRVIE